MKNYDVENVKFNVGNENENPGTNGKGSGNSRPEPRRPEARRPATTIARGNVRVTIWANPTAWGDVQWKVRFARVYFRPSQSGYAGSFDVNDLRDLIQGAFDARRWIAKAEKRLKRHRWLMSWI